MSSSFRTKVVYYISLIAIVAWLGIFTPAVALGDATPDGDISTPIAAPEPSAAVLTGLGIAGLAVVRWLKKR
jgi:hypothetical protein